MLQKDPRKRITIPEIKVHPWVTSRGRTPMISTEENCIYEDVTAEELANALSHSVTFVTRMVDIVKRKLSLGVPKSRAASVRHGGSVPI